MSLFTIPIPPTGGTITCTTPSDHNLNLNLNLNINLDEETSSKIYILTITSPKDNRLTPALIDALLLALDILEHRFPKGVVVTTSGIAKFYSNGLDLRLAETTEGFLERYLWRLFRRLITYPMPTLSLLNGHAFAAGLMLAMYHDYRIQNPSRGFLCLNELEFGVPLQTPMMAVFREKLAPGIFRDVVLEAKRFGGRMAMEAGIVDGLGGLGEAVRFIVERGLAGKAETGIYGVLKEEMYKGVLGVLDDHEGNLRWRGAVEGRKRVIGEEGERGVRRWEEEMKKGKEKEEKKGRDVKL